MEDDQTSKLRVTANLPTTGTAWRNRLLTIGVCPRQSDGGNKLFYLDHIIFAWHNECPATSLGAAEKFSGVAHDIMADEAEEKMAMLVVPRDSQIPALARRGQV